MIVVKNLTKIYKTKYKKDIIAINDVSFVLPDKGLVFIIGKSGSGKSTMLNMLAGLDMPTSGEIIADGHNLSKFKEKDFIKYRSSYIGFIFQDYHVLDNLTVRENIKLAMDIVNNHDDEKISQVMRKVDLVGYDNRYPKELSGGQKQRISVARALVKDVNVILCDEPTGNLDKKTSAQVLEMLKKLSTERLVIVVSHNMVEANTYADRIIELADGKIVLDHERSANYSNEFKIEDGVIYLPHYNDLNTNELMLVNETIQNSENIKFKQIGNRFYDTKIEEKEIEPIKLESHRMSRRSSKKVFKLFFSKRRGSFILSIFIISLLLTCFAIFQSFLNFDGNQQLLNSISNYDFDTIALHKNYSESTNESMSTTMYKVENSDIETFVNNGYSGKIYKKYNNNLVLGTLTSYMFRKSMASYKQNVTNFYIKESFGVINCDEEYLIKLYGKDGKINYLAGSSEGKEYGIVIPDYLADCCLFYSKANTYDELIGVFQYQNYNIAYINGIFDTDYETKYKVLKDAFDTERENPNAASNKYSNLQNDPIYAEFLYELNNFLGVGYNFSENYEEVIKTRSLKSYGFLTDFYVNEKGSNDKTKIYEMQYFYSSNYPKYNLQPGEIMISYSAYNALEIDDVAYTKSNYSSFKEPKEIIITFHKNSNKNQEVVFQKTFKIVALTQVTNIINDSDCEELRKFDIIPYELYFDNFSDGKKLLEISDEVKYMIFSGETTTLYTVNRVLNVFGKFFIFLELFFLLVCTIYLVGMSVSNVRKNKYEIGVIKAIGVSQFDLYKVFIRQTLRMCLLILIVANLGIFLGTKVANFILITSFEKILNIKIINLVLISYMPSLVISDLIDVIIVIIFSAIIPLIMLSKIKPIEILRAKE